MRTGNDTAGVWVQELRARDGSGQRWAWVVVCAAGGAPFVVSYPQAALALELSGVPMREGMSAAEVAVLVLAALDRVGVDRVRDLEYRTRMAACGGLDTGDWAEYDRLVRGQDAESFDRAQVAVGRLVDAAEGGLTVSAADVSAFGPVVADPARLAVV